MALPPELNDDVTAEILLRVAPDDPTGLFRASLVCKLWHRIISDPNFCRRYRSFHRGAPLLLGFFYNLDFPAGTFSGSDFPAPFSRFVPTTAASPPLPKVAVAATHEHDDGRRVSWALDCRHGRVLFEKADDSSGGLAVWDPITDGWTDLPPPGIKYACYIAAVICDVAGCDHRDCRRGGRFRVVCIGRGENLTICACVYSSEDRAWQAPVSSGWCWNFELKRPAVVGDGIYCTFCSRRIILMYDLVKRRFSSIDMPDRYKRDPVLMQNEDGSLGLAGVRGSTLYLWSRIPNNPKVGRRNAGCVQWRVDKKLSKVLRVDNKQCNNANVIGFAEGVGVFFIKTNDGVFTLELKSRRLMKVSNPRENYPSVVPLISFISPDPAS